MTDDDSDDARLADRVHTALGPLREQVIRVSQDFTRRVSKEIEALLHKGPEAPSLLTLLGSALLEAINIVTHGSDLSRDGSDEEP